MLLLSLVMVVFCSQLNASVDVQVGGVAHVPKRSVEGCGPVGIVERPGVEVAAAGWGGAVRGAGAGETGGMTTKKQHGR